MIMVHIREYCEILKCLCQSHKNVLLDKRRRLWLIFTIKKKTKHKYHREKLCVSLEKTSLDRSDFNHKAIAS